MPKGKRGKAFKLGLDTEGQQNQIGIVNKQKSTDPNASGQNKRTVKDGVKWRNDGRTGEGPVRPTKQTPKPTKTKTTKTKAVEKGPSKKVEEGPSKKVKKGVPKVKPAEAEGKYTTTKRSAAHTRTGHAENTQTYKVASRGRYRGKGVVGRR